MDCAPNFFVIGAMKAGTTSLAKCLNAHPEVFMCRPKEPHYFSRWHGSPGALDTYLRLFDEGRHARYRGDASTSYSKEFFSERTADRIAAFCGEARIIYVLRDPVERTISEYWHCLRQGWEDRELLDSLGSEPNAGRQYWWNSYYARQLRRYLAHFRRDQVLVLVSEEMRTDMIGTCQRVYRWLGVDDQFTPPTELQRVHVTPESLRARVRSPRVERIKRHPWVWGARSRLPKGVRRLLSNVVERGKTYDRDDSRSRAQVAAAEQLIRPRMRDWTEELSELLGRNFSLWAKLYAP